MAIKELTKGSPAKLITVFMLPLFIGNVFQVFYNIVDALIVGRIIGINALGAVGATSSLIFLVISFVFASTQGFTVITAQRFGAGDHDGVRKSVATSIVLSAGLTVILTLLSAPFSRQLLELLQTPPEIIDMSTQYLFIMFAGIFATVFYNLGSNVIRALGDSKTPLYFLIFATVLNMILAYSFVKYLRLGVAGAGIATVIAQFIATILCLSFMFAKFPIVRLKKSDWQIDRKFALLHLNTGIPMGLQMSVLSLGIVVLQFVINGFGTDAVAAYTTAIRIEQIFSQAFVALGAAMAVYTAQNYGAKKMSRIRKGSHFAVALVIGLCIAALVIIKLFAPAMISVFMDVPKPEVVSLACEYLNIVVLFYIFLGILLVYRNVLQGSGNVITPLFSGTSELIMRAGGAVILGHYFGFTGVCYASPAAWVCAAIVLYVGYKFTVRMRVMEFRRNKSLQTGKQ